MRPLLLLACALMASAVCAAPGPRPVNPGPRPPGGTWRSRYHATPLPGCLLTYRRALPAASLPFYAVRATSRLRPHAQVWRPGRCGDGRYVTADRYRYGGRQALFDGAGRQLTGFDFAQVVAVGAGCLAYTTVEADEDYWWPAHEAAGHSGLPRPWCLDGDPVAQRPSAFGLLDRAGHRLTPPAYVRLQGLAPNAVWAVRVEAGQLAYGLLDSLGRVVLPFAAGPLSLADQAGLVRRRSAAPLPYANGPNESTYNGPPRYADTTTTRYYRLDGRPLPGHFTAAGACWEGWAVVQVGSRYGVVDADGRWLTPLGPADLRTLPRSMAQGCHDEETDPMSLFDPLDAERTYWWESSRVYYY